MAIWKLVDWHIMLWNWQIVHLKPLTRAKDMLFNTFVTIIFTSQTMQPSIFRNLPFLLIELLSHYSFYGMPIKRHNFCLIYGLQIAVFSHEN